MAKHRILSAMVTLAFGVVLAAGPVRAADAQLNTGSVKLVTWELELPGGVKAKLTAASGEVVRLTRDDGSELAFIPEVALNSPVKIKVFEVAHEGGKESLRPVDAMEIVPGEEAFSRNVSGLTMRLARGGAGHPLEKGPTKSAGVGVSPSDMLVRWDLTLPTGRVVKIISREGELTRLKLQDGQSFGFVPFIREEGSVSFRVFSLVRVKGVGETLHPMETFDVQPGSDYFPRTLASSLVRVTDVRKISPADREALSKLMADTPGDTTDGCCVSCGGTRVCGCSVGMDCGDCCVPPCCFLAY